VVTDHQPGHGPFEELAAGYALDALEPADEQRFLRHARGCQACARALADFREVAAALAETAPPAEPRSQLADRILAAALADLDPGYRPATASADSAPAAGFPPPAATAAVPGASDRATPGDPAAAALGDALPPGVVPLRPRARRWLRPASAAAAAALIAGGGTWAGLAATSSGSPPPACAHPHACPQVTLIAEATHQVAATVMIRGGGVWVKPARMAANPADDVYVLWQITSSHRPLAVGSFDVRPGAHTQVRIGALAAAYRGTLAFAVSLEHGRTIPAAPSRVLALGQVS
jgi:anti-sigma-K factor RskA